MPTSKASKLRLSDALPPDTPKRADYRPPTIYPGGPSRCTAPVRPMGNLNLDQNRITGSNPLQTGSLSRR